MLDVADGVDDILTGGVMLGLKGHGTVSISYKKRDKKTQIKVSVKKQILFKYLMTDVIADVTCFIRLVLLDNEN